MLRNTIKNLMFAAALLMAPAAFAENPNAGMYTTVTTCAPDYNVTTCGPTTYSTSCLPNTTSTTCAPDYDVTTANPYQVCHPYDVTTDLGYNRCTLNGDKASTSGDFAVGGTCVEATETNTYQACSIAYTYSTVRYAGACTTVPVAGLCTTTPVAGVCTTSLVKGACTTTQVPVNSGGSCTGQSHHCNNGGGPGG